MGLLSIGPMNHARVLAVAWVSLFSSPSRPPAELALTGHKKLLTTGPDWGLTSLAGELLSQAGAPIVCVGVNGR